MIFFAKNGVFPVKTPLIRVKSMKNPGTSDHLLHEINLNFFQFFLKKDTIKLLFYPKYIGKGNQGCRFSYFLIESSNTFQSSGFSIFAEKRVKFLTMSCKCNGKFISLRAFPRVGKHGKYY